VRHLARKLAFQYPMKNIVFLCSETGQGKTSTLRHIASACISGRQAVSWMGPSTTSNRMFPNVSAQLLLNLRLPFSGPDAHFLSGLSSNEHLSATVASTISSELSLFEDRSEALTHMLMGFARSSRRVRRLTMDWLRGLPVPRSLLAWSSELAQPPYETGVGLATSVSEVPFYRTASFVSALLHGLGFEGLTVFIDDIDEHLRLARRYAEVLAHFWRKGWPFEYMNMHKNTRLNFVMAGTQETANMISVPTRIVHCLNPDVSAVVSGIAPKIRRCKEIARHRRIQQDATSICANRQNNEPGTVRVAISNLVRQTLS